jgi:hypothetical protein
MANYGPADLTVEYDNAGGSLVDITAHVLTVNDIDVENLTEEVRPFGASWDTHKTVGVGRMPVVELGGVYDDTAATGPDALFAGRVPVSPGTSTRTLQFTWGGSKTTSVETILLGYRRTVDSAGLTRWLARLQPTGAVSET